MEFPRGRFRQQLAGAVVFAALALGLCSCDIFQGPPGPAGKDGLAGPASCTLTLTAFPGGSSSPTGRVTVAAGDATPIQAVATSGFTFRSWIVETGEADVANPAQAATTVTLRSGDATLKAVFAHTGSSVPAGFLANYPLDGSAVDSLGGLNGTVTNASAAPDRHSVDGGAMFFDGTGAYVQTVPPGSMPTSLSVAVWINPTALGRQVWGSILNPSGGKNGFVLVAGPDGSLGFQRYYANAASNAITTPGSQLALNTWRHVVVTFDGSTGDTAIYVDGALAGSGVCSILSGANDIPLTFGIGLLQQTYYFFSGSMDQARVYSRALTMAEVYDLYSNGG